MRTTALICCAAALVAAGCGGEDGGADAASPQERAQDGALKFAQCMRSNGVDVPDPQVGENGLIRIAPGPGGPGVGQAPDSPVFRKAEAACRKHLRAGGEPPDEATQAKLRDAAVKYAQFMRSKGIDMPDPQADGGLVLGRGPGGINPEAPAFKRAEAACRDLLPGVGDVAVEGP